MADDAGEPICPLAANLVIAIQVLREDGAGQAALSSAIEAVVIKSRGRTQPEEPPRSIREWMALLRENGAESQNHSFEARTYG